MKAGLGLAAGELASACSQTQHTSQRAPLAHIAPAEAGFDPDRLAALHGFIEAELGAGLAPGAVLAISRHGRVVDERCWGTCCSTTQPSVPVTPDTRHMVYSFSKVITSTVTAIAQEKGLLQYDAPVARYIPEFAQNGKQGITLRHCLTHSAGIPNAPAAPAYSPEQWREAVKTLCRAELEWKPGSRTDYHALSGMHVLAEVVLRTSGAPSWESVCREWLFDPLGCQTMSFRADQVDSLALTPQPDSVPVTLDTNLAPMLGTPGGGLIARPEDMLRVLQLHLNRGEWRGRRVVRPETIDAMHRVHYAGEIQKALATGQTPDHEPWGLGLLTRAHTTTGWFGFGSKASPKAYGHAGIDTVIGIADPVLDAAWVFLTTHSPGDDDLTTRVRNRVSDLVVESIRA